MGGQTSIRSQKLKKYYREGRPLVGRNVKKHYREGRPLVGAVH